MCGRYVSPDQAALERHWHIGRHNSNPFVRRYNVAPTTLVPVLRRDAQTGELELLAATWGLIPVWWKESKPPRFTFNARSEEAASKPMWRSPLLSARCLIPAEGWYEWREMERLDAASGEIRLIKQPLFIRARKQELFAFAGVMSTRKGAAGDPAHSCAILTAAAVPATAEVHERMPVVLRSEAHAAWLDREMNDAAKAVQLALAHLESEFYFHAVSPRVNIARNDDASLIEQAESGRIGAGKMP